MAVQRMQMRGADPVRDVQARATRREGEGDGKRRTTGMADLVQSAAAGDEAAWEAIVARYSGRLWGVVRAYRLNDSDAADVLQITWTRLVQHLGQIREPEALGAWLAITARRECLRMTRRAGRECCYGRMAEDGVRLEAGDRLEPSAETQALAAEMGRVLWARVDELPEHCRTLLRMLMADPPPTYEEVSAILGRPVGSIGPTRARCLQCLRGAIERTGILEESARAPMRRPA
ncbi:MAG: RNA polymerase sigma factor [Egibacteraceae bacterium]